MRAIGLQPIVKRVLRPIGPDWLILGAILALAALLRLHNIGFGLPALYDPDEPIFVLSAIRMVSNASLDPGWFGHPGTTTIYAMALVGAIMFVGGWALGYWVDPKSCLTAVYANPGIVFLGGRLFIALCALGCVLFTYMIGRRLFGRRIGLAAAALLALDPVHVTYSQIIRTDVHASFFMLLCSLATIGIVRHGRIRDYLFAAVFAGLACATKWPAAVVLTGIVAASALRIFRNPGELRPQLSRLALALAASAATLVLTSPYLFIEAAKVAADLHGEARGHHVGATGYGAIGNAGWYLMSPIRASVGLTGIALAILGAVNVVRRNAEAAAILLVPAMTFFVAICVQALIWERWIVPLLPVVALLAAVGAATVANVIFRRLGPSFAGPLTAALLGLLIVPMIIGNRARAAERATDTRGLASAWGRAHFAPGSTVVVEHGALDLFNEPWKFLFPVGEAGCVDAREQLRGKFRYSTVSRWRNGRAVIDLGSVTPQTIATCRGDYLIFTNYDRYLADPKQSGDQLANYDWLIRHGKIVATFSPVAGSVGGPVVRIVQMSGFP